MQFSRFDQNEIVAHPHNIILQLLVEWGVFAMLLAVDITYMALLNGSVLARNK